MTYELTRFDFEALYRQKELEREKQFLQKRLSEVNQELNTFKDFDLESKIESPGEIPEPSKLDEFMQSAFAIVLSTLAIGGSILLIL